MEALLAYMRRVIVKLIIVEEYRMFCMVELDQMLQCPSRFLSSRLDIIDLHRFHFYSGSATALEEARNSERILKGQHLLVSRRYLSMLNRTG